MYELKNTSGTIADLYKRKDGDIHILASAIKEQLPNKEDSDAGLVALMIADIYFILDSMRLSKGS